MCLIANSYVKTAKKDIDCYKIIRVTKNWDGTTYRIQSPFRLTVINGPTMVAENSLKGQLSFLSHVSRKIGFLYKKDIQEGIHSFVTQEDAIENQISNSIILKCIIPKGTRYLTGNMSIGGYDNLVSEKLILKSVCDPFVRLLDISMLEFLATFLCPEREKRINQALDEILDELNKM